MAVRTISIRFASHGRGRLKDARVKQGTRHTCNHVDPKKRAEAKGRDRVIWA